MTKKPSENTTLYLSAEQMVFDGTADLDETPLSVQAEKKITPPHTKETPKVSSNTKVTPDSKQGWSLGSTTRVMPGRNAEREVSLDLPAQERTGLEKFAESKRFTGQNLGTENAKAAFELGTTRPSGTTLSSPAYLGSDLTQGKTSYTHPQSGFSLGTKPTGNLSHEKGYEKGHEKGIDKRVADSSPTSKTSVWSARFPDTTQRLSDQRLNEMPTRQTVRTEPVATSARYQQATSRNPEAGRLGFGSQAKTASSNNKPFTGVAFNQLAPKIDTRGELKQAHHSIVHSSIVEKSPTAHTRETLGNLPQENLHTDIGGSHNSLGTDFEASLVTEQVAPEKTSPIRNLKTEAVSYASSDASSGTGSVLTDLAQLIANVTESHTVVIFEAETSTRTLQLRAFQTLSRDLIPNARIKYGAGLVGWAAENALRISVCPFENDATTLLYYNSDQELKSFIAVPVVGRNGQLLAVIACDNKRSYAYAKVTEKILLDCAKQCAHLLELSANLVSSTVPSGGMHRDATARILDQLRCLTNEEELLNATTNLPQEVVPREALVVMTTAEGGVGAGRFFPPTMNTEVENRLLSLVCKQKRVLCPNRSMHSLPVDDLKQRSFLSIPFRVLGTEAGSINLLSQPRSAFDSQTVNTLEQISEVIGTQLEAIRLREKAFQNRETDTLLPWKQFGLTAKSRISEAKRTKTKLSLLRLSFQGLPVIERLIGIDGASEVTARISRLVAQVVRSPSAACSLYGLEFLILTEANEASALLTRFDRLLARLATDESTFSSHKFHSKDARENLSSLLRNGLLVSSARYPEDGEEISQLAERCRERLVSSEELHHMGEVANVGSK